jgi:hypothetical protein
MSFPSSIDSPTVHLDRITSLGLDGAVGAFNHFQSRPVQSGDRHNESLTQEWCERMDTIGTQPEYSDQLGALSQLCAGMVAEFESALTKQKENDLAESMRAQEEEKRKSELARQAAEQEEKEKQERLVMERKREDIAAVE